MQTMKHTLKELLISLFVLGAFIFICKKVFTPRLSGDLHNIFKDAPKIQDSLVQGRDMGIITLRKFVERVNSTGVCKINKTRDSIEFLLSKEDQHIFFAGNSFDKLNKIKNLPIHIKPSGSFTAKVYNIDSVNYINIPYHILFSLIKNTERIMSSPSLHDNEKPSPTIHSNTNIEYNGENKLIQTEGLVYQNVSQILSGYKTYGSQFAQIKILWSHAYNNWNYVHDPNFVQTGADTWRSAEQTIDNYYLSSKPHKYTGDCDDFAILMASFARQIGLRSRFVCATSSSGGHAYAEFFVPDNKKEEMKEKLGNVNYIKDNGGIWVNMDWWGEDIGGPYFNDGKGRRKVTENI